MKLFQLICSQNIANRHNCDLFRDPNILRNAEAVYGGKLPQVANLPHLVCRACVRRLNNFSQYRSIVTETQKRYTKDICTKRCLELSPSVVTPSAKVQATGESRRRSLDFTHVDAGRQTESSSIHLSKFFTPAFFIDQCERLVQTFRL